MPGKIKGAKFDVVVDRRGDGDLFVLDHEGNPIHSPIGESDEDVIQWAIDYVLDMFVRDSLESLYNMEEL